MKFISAKLAVVLILWSLLAVAAPGQGKSPDSRLSLERIFNSREFAPERFGPARWLKDGKSYTTIEDSSSVQGGRDIVVYDAATGKRRVLVPSSRLVPAGGSTALAVEDYRWSDDGGLLLVFTNSKRVWRQNTRGDFWILDLASGGLRKLGSDFEPATLQFAKISPDGRRAAYVQKNDIYSEDLATGRVVRLTFDGSATMANGTSDWVYEEEFSLRDAFRWSPDGAAIAFWQIDSAGITDFDLINNTDTLYPRVLPLKYPKAGEPNSLCRIGVVNAGGGPVTWLKVTGDPVASYIPWMDWAPDSREILLQHINRLQNANELMIAEASTGDVRTVFVDRDDAWVDVVNDIVWLGGGKEFTWTSEKDGWRHVYRVSRADGKAVPVTAGAFDILGIDAIDIKGGWLLFTASPDNPAQRYLFRSRLDGRGRAERLSPSGQPGTHSYQISPTGEWAIHTYSNFGTPPVTDLVRLPRHESARTLAANGNLLARVKALDGTPVEFFRVDIGGGVALDGWCMKPPDFNPEKSYPLLFHIYGEPAGQTVLDRWGGSGYLWHLMLAQQGYLVASIDPRGTPAPRGREWRKCVYRRVGILAPEDHAAGAREFLRTRPYVDASRVGIWGWSGGGQMTLNAMFKFPDLYKTGIAVAFVSDQHLYDTIYQERFMGLPRDNEEGYRDGSPVNFAKNLKGDLLIIHGTGDDNVHYQSFERLVNELVAQGKSFTMMAYPNRSHGIFEGAGTTMHLYKTMTRFLNEKMPPGPRIRN